jgi:hypothetical protein
MKRKLRVVLIAAFLTAAPLLIMAQAPPHPNGGNAPGGSNGPVGGGAPLGSGTIILVTLAVVYSGRKVYFMKRAIEA